MQMEVGVDTKIKYSLRKISFCDLVKVGQGERDMAEHLGMETYSFCCDPSNLFRILVNKKF